MRERKRERKRESKRDGGIEGEKYSGMEGSNGREWERGRENWYDFQGATSVMSFVHSAVLRPCCSGLSENIVIVLLTKSKPDVLCVPGPWLARVCKNPPLSPQPQPPNLARAGPGQSELGGVNARGRR